MQKRNNRTLTAALIAFIIGLGLSLCTSAAMAATAADGSNPAAATDAPATGVMTNGDVRKVDSAAGKLTIRHGPIDNLDMAAMTMVFRVPDRALLAGVKEGDAVRFHAERVDGALTVTRIAPAQ